MDDITSEMVDEILGEAYALLRQAERICLHNNGSEYLQHLNPVLEKLSCIPSAHGDERKILYEPIPE